MAEIRPFRGLRYNEALSARMGSLISPPYDVIPPDREPVFRRLSPYNVIHVELPEAGPEGDRYRHAGVILKEWMRRSLLTRLAGYYCLENKAAIKRETEL